MNRTVIGGLLVLTISLGVFATALARGQTTQSAQKSVEFEVASVKANTSADAVSTIGFGPGGRFRAINMPIVRLIQEAFATAATPRPQVVGAPGWVQADRFDIEAVANGNPAPEQRQMMLRALLADRFRLASHLETRTLPVYDLVRPSRDGKPGDKLRVSDGACDAIRKPGAASAPEVLRSCLLAFGTGSLRVNGMTAAQFAVAGLTRVVDRPVIDRTGLGATSYDWVIEWADQSSRPAGNDADLPSSVFSAVEEQLGLRLEPATGPVDVVVIDRVEKPTPN
jgi:uncharacterized protein (TIGR03435 family)